MTQIAGVEIRQVYRKVGKQEAYEAALAQTVALSPDDLREFDAAYDKIHAHIKLHYGYLEPRDMRQVVGRAIRDEREVYRARRIEAMLADAREYMDNPPPICEADPYSTPHPCPFCDSFIVHVELRISIKLVDRGVTKHSIEAQVRCKSCGATGPRSFDSDPQADRHHVMRKAAEAWNDCPRDPIQPQQHLAPPTFQST